MSGADCKHAELIAVVLCGVARDLRQNLNFNTTEEPFTLSDVCITKITLSIIRSSFEFTRSPPHPPGFALSGKRARVCLCVTPVTFSPP